METPISSETAAKTGPTIEPLIGAPAPLPTWYQTLRKHIVTWLEIWVWMPLSLLSIWLFAKFGYFLTGRRPQENVDWIVGLGGNLVKCVFVILLVSILRQQTGVWLTRDELLENPNMAWSQTITKCVSLIVFAWLVSH